MQTPDLARILADDWPSIVGVGLVGFLSRRSLPGVSQLRCMVSADPEAQGTPEDDPLATAARDLGTTFIGMVWRFTMPMAMMLGMFGFLCFRSSFPDHPKWHAYFVAPAVGGLLMWLTDTFWRKALSQRLVQIHPRTK